jgi:hypothetical protein
MERMIAGERNLACLITGVKMSHPGLGADDLAHRRRENRQNCRSRFVKLVFMMPFSAEQQFVLQCNCNACRSAAMLGTLASNAAL